MTHFPVLKSSLIFLLVMQVSCNLLTGTDSKDDDSLYVKFTNSEASEFVITDIELRPLGRYDSEVVTPAGDWSGNILPDSETVSPGAHVFFTLDIPSGHHSEYRLGVEDENGNRIMLHAQSGYTDDQLTGTITHWGSDKRSVDVTVVRDQESDLIIVSGYSDWAGIE